jgi:hypothetical protein
LGRAAVQALDSHQADNDRREPVAPSQFILPSLQFFFIP